MSRIYASGNKTVAIANIKADLAAFITVGTDGAKRLNTVLMNQYLIAQFALLSTSDGIPPAPATPQSVAAAARAVDTMMFVNSLNDQIRPEVMASRADWPQVEGIATGTNVASAVAAAQADLAKLSQRVTDHYSWLSAANNVELTDQIQAFWYEQDLDSTIPAGVVRQVETRSVIYTYVTDRDEESAPSEPADLVDMDQNDTATYAAGAPPSGRHIDRVRWYRSNSSNAGAAFQFTGEKPVSEGLTFTDTLKAAELQEPCPTLTWTEPRENLIGMAAGPNGQMAGGYGNTFCLCEPYAFYAWPREYEISLEHPFVGCIAFDQGWFIGTRGRPYLATGADPQSTTARKIDSNQPLVSRRGLVTWNGGVLYPSADGWCWYDGSRVKVLTGDDGWKLWTRAQWQALQPETIFAAEHENTLYFWCKSGTEAYALNLLTGKLVTLDRSASAVFRNLMTDRLYVASGTTIQELFSASTRRTARWKSKRAVAPQEVNLGWVMAESDFTAPVTVRVHRNGQLTDSKMLAGLAARRLQSRSAKEHEIEVEGAGDITAVVTSNTSEGLRGV